VIAWAAETALALTALCLLVLAIRGPVARGFGAGWAYALWLLPLARLITPPLGLISAELADAVPPMMVVVTGSGEMAASLPPIGGPGQWVPLLLALWAGGAAVFLLWQWQRYRAFLAQVYAEARPGYPGDYRDIPVIESRGVDGPLAVGLAEPRIVVPFDFLSRYRLAEQELALAHEWIHHRRGDLWWNVVALVLLGLNWFNPIAWIAFRAFRADQELACDARVLAGAPETLRHAYGLALVKSASRPGLIAACPLNHSDQLKRRLKMMKSHRASTLRSLAGGLVVAGTFGVGLCLSAPTLAQDAKDEPKIERRVILKEVGKGGDLRARLPDDLREKLRNCPEAQKLESDISSGEGDKQQRTRIVICNKDGKAPTPEMRERLMAALDRARTEFESDKELTPAQRAKVVEALRREIEKMRAEGK
jgi:beta-lactamase regulating signal transducer with metallopeptidase domain